MMQTGKMTAKNMGSSYAITTTVAAVENKHMYITLKRKVI